MRPVAIDPLGLTGPTRGQAQGPGWRRVAPGLFVPSETGSGPEQRILEQSMWLPCDGAVTGWAALRLGGAAFFDGLEHGDPLPVPLTSLGRRSFRVGTSGRLVRADREGAALSVRHGIPVAPMLPALLEEIRRRRGLRSAVEAIDMALAGRVIGWPETRAWFAGHAGRLAREALALADAGSWSPYETRMRLIWTLDAGCPRPRCNRPLLDRFGHHLGTPDLLDPVNGVVGEYDGAEHRSRERHARDVVREDAFRSAGLEYVAAVGRDVHRVAPLVDRIRRAYARAARLDGPRAWTLDPPPWWQHRRV